MYEILLMLNIVWELGKLYLWPVLALLLLWLLLVFSARDRLHGRHWRRFAIVTAVSFPVAVLAVPWLTRSSIAEVRYVLDWLALIGLAAAASMIVAAFAVPLSVLAARRRPSVIATKRARALA
jgi:hypothetical protein